MGVQKSSCPRQLIHSIIQSLDKYLLWVYMLRHYWFVQNGSLIWSPIHCYFYATCSQVLWKFQIIQEMGCGRTQERLPGAGRIWIEFQLSRWREGNWASEDINNSVTACVQKCRLYPEGQTSEAKKAQGWYNSGIPLGTFQGTSNSCLLHLLGSSH